MTLQDFGAIGELVGGLAVVLSLVYVAYQIRQNSRLIEQNSRNLEASMYFSTGEDFNRWWALLAQDPEVARLWLRGVAGETLAREDRTRFNALVTTLFINYENNFHQFRLGAVHRDTLEISREIVTRLRSAPGIREWWATEAPRVLTPEFRAAVDRVASGDDPPREPQDRS